MKIVFRGTSDALGVPRLYCSCKICLEARTSGGNRRSRPSVQLFVTEHESFWIDCGPDWYTQMETAQQQFISNMLITHAHYDHIGGLPQWYDQCRYVESPAKLFAAQEVIDEILHRFPWLSGRIQFIPIDEGLQIGDWKLRTWRVNHGRNGYSYAFRFDHNDNSFVYCPDSIALNDEEQRLLKDVDILIIGASFYQEPFPFETRSLYDVTELIGLQRVWCPRQMYITHMSHDIDIRSELPEGIYYAKEGQVLLINE